MNIATHDEPALRSESDFIFMAALDAHGMPGKLEQLWGRRISDSLVMVCCIPFFTYGVALRDEVVIRRDDSAGYLLASTSRRRGHRVWRLAVCNRDEASALHPEVHRRLAALGVAQEWMADGYVAVDIPPTMSGEDVSLGFSDLVGRGAVAIELD